MGVAKTTNISETMHPSRPHDRTVKPWFAECRKVRSLFIRSSHFGLMGYTHYSDVYTIQIPTVTMTVTLAVAVTVVAVTVVTVAVTVNVTVTVAVAVSRSR